MQEVKELFNWPQLGITIPNVIQFSVKYNKIRTFRTSELQHATLLKMKSYNIDVSRFIRDAIREKIQRDYKSLIPKTKSKYSNEIQNILNKLSEY